MGNVYYTMGNVYYKCCPYLSLLLLFIMFGVFRGGVGAGGSGGGLEVRHILLLIKMTTAVVASSPSQNDTIATTIVLPKYLVSTFLLHGRR